MNEGTLSTAFSPNFATKLCFFVLVRNLSHGPRPVQTFPPLPWASNQNLWPMKAQGCEKESQAAGLTGPSFTPSIAG